MKTFGVKDTCHCDVEIVKIPEISLPWYKTVTMVLMATLFDPLQFTFLPKSINIKSIYIEHETSKIDT